MRKGVLVSILTAMISGFSVFANKLFVSNADPLIFSVVRNTVVGLMLTSILIASKKFPAVSNISGKDWMKLLFIGIFGGGVAFALFFTGLAKIGAVQGNLIHKTLFLWVALLAIPLLQERPGFMQVAGYALIFWATFFFGGGADFQLNSGSVMVLAATVLWALETVTAKTVLTRVPSHVVGLLRIVIGIPVLALIALTSGKGPLLLAPQTYAVLPLVVSSLFLTGYVLSWYYALASLPATVATSILILAPLITAFLSSAFLTHTILSPQQSASFALIAAGVALIAVRMQRLRNNRRYDV